MTLPDTQTLKNRQTHTRRTTNFGASEIKLKISIIFVSSSTRSIPLETLDHEVFTLPLDYCANYSNFEQRLIFSSIHRLLALGCFVALGFVALGCSQATEHASYSSWPCDTIGFRQQQL
jgi:hypothetical protein